MDQEAIKTLMEWATQIKDGVSAELPKLAEEIVAFELWSSVAWIIVCLLTIRASCVLIKKTTKRREEHKATDDDGVTFMVCLVLGVLSTIMLLVNINDTIKAATAPRLVVVEKVVNMVKSSTR